ncbi:kinase-like domain-containing protein [Hyaloraphidium curvatum]|nr:kinase-like domain-containing protein [Hyaloraphidium curvatum]
MSSSSEGDHFGRVERRRDKSRSRSGSRSPRPDPRRHSRSRSRDLDAEAAALARQLQRTQFLAPSRPAPNPIRSNAPSPIVDPHVGEGEEVLSVGKIAYYPKRAIGRSTEGSEVYLGTYQGGRPAAVKRVKDGDSGWRAELGDLVRIDTHSNIVRLFGWEDDPGTDRVLIAMELCRCSVQDLVSYDGPAADALALREKLLCHAPRVLKQLLNALAFVHSQGLAHLNLRPSNVLVPAIPPGMEFRIVISDFGHLGRNADAFPSSLEYSAPEIIARARARDVNGGISNGGSNGKDGSLDPPVPATSPPTPKLGNGGAALSSSPPRSPFAGLLKDAIGPPADVFSAGLFIFYLLTGGLHPFIGRSPTPDDPDAVRAILDGRTPALDILDSSPLCSGSGEEAKKLTKWMLKRYPAQRPAAGLALHHPFFWPAARRLEFLRVAADRVKVEQLDSDVVRTLEREARWVFPSGDWIDVLDSEVSEQLTKVSKYDGTMLRDLLKAVRNLRNHLTELPPGLQRLFESYGGLYPYVSSLFPRLLMATFKVVYKETDLGREQGLRIFLEKEDD